ncbi:DEAD/DEAH box helicase [Geomonas sp. RF6]|uniref:DEAD/DEAH box helicase n=1 Tax=Geomonas sp. RF6 TaxID=2897342 RepID=UPI001E46E907|nr:DEAD/DEAH box helicase [Geomonas sp. RF6]UFS71972.1 DEAD/DEAH box helicase [Geomonas sp. RF6]
MSFETLNLAQPILKAIAARGYTDPTPIQEQAIPLALAGKDLIGTAQTGTGKTAAFVLPALQRLLVPSTARGKGPRILVLTPTRELANQVTDAVRAYGKFMRVRSGAILGGMPYREQLALLSAPVDLIVATPGRLIDHLERGRMNLSRLELLVLDEADRMLDMGFSEDVDKIAAAAPEARQTMLFTATMDDAMAKLAKRLLTEPERIDVAPQQITKPQIEQRLHVTDDIRHKNRLLQHLISDINLTKAIIFSATKTGADQLAMELYSQGHAAAALHGDMSQGARNRTIVNMRRGKVRLLVATDVAARGLDVSGISHVINFDLPKFAEDYVHRIGRTGRAGASGVAISFCSFNEVAYLDRIEKYTGESLPHHVIPGLEPTRQLRRTSGNAPRKGRPFGDPRKKGAPFAKGRPKQAGSGRREPVVEYRHGRGN